MVPSSPTAGSFLEDTNSFIAVFICWYLLGIGVVVVGARMRQKEDSEVESVPQIV